MEPVGQNVQVAALSTCDQTSYEHQPEPFCPPKGNKLSSSPHFFGCQYVLHNPMNHLLVLLDAELSGGGGGGEAVCIFGSVFLCVGGKI